MIVFILFYHLECPMLMLLYNITHFVLAFYTLVFIHVNMENVFVVIKQVDKKDW